MAADGFQLVTGRRRINSKKKNAAVKCSFTSEGASNRENTENAEDVVKRVQCSRYRIARITVYEIKINGFNNNFRSMN